MASEIPATAEVTLKTDASKQFLDSLLGQGWDAWGQGLGGSEAAELMLQLFSAFNLVALAVLSALFIWVMAVAVAGTAHEGTAFGKRFSSLWMPLRFVGAMGALAPIFNWIGQQFHSLGEKEVQAGVKGVFVSSTNAVSSGAHGVKELRKEEWPALTAAQESPAAQEPAPATRMRA